MNKTTDKWVNEQMNEDKEKTKTLLISGVKCKKKTEETDLLNSAWPQTEVEIERQRMRFRERRWTVVVFVECRK